MARRLAPAMIHEVIGTVPNVGVAGSRLSVHITSMPPTLSSPNWPAPRDPHVWNSPRHFLHQNAVDPDPNAKQSELFAAIDPVADRLRAASLRSD